MTFVFAVLFAVCGLVGVVLDLRRKPSRWRFVWWLASNAGNLAIIGGVAAGWLPPVNGFPVAVLYAVYLGLAVKGFRDNFNKRAGR